MHSETMECLYMLKEFLVKAKEMNDYDDVIQILELTRDERKNLTYY